MGRVISFRASDEEWDLIERTRLQKGFGTSTDAIRFLIGSAPQGKPRLKPSEDPFYKLRLPGVEPGGASMTSEEIDDFLYGEDIVTWKQRSGNADPPELPELADRDGDDG